ncbi:MAG: hypothetical protein JNL74_02145 [Fibrobacteres bacterium]|nr:hypothetical protein [Fibrobacterota bacterium]
MMHHAIHFAMHIVGCNSWAQGKEPKRQASAKKAAFLAAKIGKKVI